MFQFNLKKLKIRIGHHDIMSENAFYHCLGPQFVSYTDQPQAKKLTSVAPRQAIAKFQFYFFH